MYKLSNYSSIFAASHSNETTNTQFGFFGFDAAHGGDLPPTNRCLARTFVHVENWVLNTGAGTNRRNSNPFKFSILGALPPIHIHVYRWEGKLSHNPIHFGFPCWANKEKTSRAFWAVFFCECLLLAHDKNKPISGLRFWRLALQTSPTSSRRLGVWAAGGGILRLVAKSCSKLNPGQTIVCWYLQVFEFLRWCRISSIHSMCQNMGRGGERGGFLLVFPVLATKRVSGKVMSEPSSDSLLGAKDLCIS